MKKVLFATTAIVAGAFAAPNFAHAQSVSAGNADITFTGLARFGVGYIEDREEEAIIISRFRLNINAAVELDSGLRLAATVRGQSDENSDGSAGALEFGGARYQISAGGFRLRLGNVSGVFDAGETIQPFADIGLEGAIGMADTFGFPGAAFGNDTGDNGVSVLYNVGSLALAATYTDESGSSDGMDEFQIGAGYSFGDYNVGVVIGEDAGEDFYAVSFDGSVGAFGFNVLIGQNDAGGNEDLAYGFAINYDVGAATNVQFVYAGGGEDVNEDDTFGVGFIHDLGPGTTMRGMVGQNTSGNTRADFGVRFNF